MQVQKHFLAAKAFLRREGRILVLRESGLYVDGVHQGRYDLPGGRLDLSESVFGGLAREVREETGMTLDMSRATPTLFFTNSVTVHKRGEHWLIQRLFFICDVNVDHITLSPDHDEARWIDPAEHLAHPVIDNLHPAFAAYTDHSAAGYAL